MPDVNQTFRLHHVGYITADLASAAELYVQRYGYAVASPVVHDPLQTALVQFLALPGDGPYLELVAPDGPESKLAAMAARRPGLHHLCYTVGSLESAIAHLRETEMLLFSDPKPAVAFDGRRICWLVGADRVLMELVERREDADACHPVTV